MTRNAVAPVRCIALCALLLPAVTFAQGGVAVSVLPFTNITGDPSDAWIGSGIAETLSADLQDAPGFEIATREPIDVPWVVSGAYQRVGDQIRITAQLVEVASGAVLRAAMVDGPLDELFELQDRLAAELARPPEVPASPIVVAVPAAVSGGDVDAPPMIDGPPPPIAPAVISRDDQGNATVRAIKLDEDIAVDGVLDEAIYTTVPSFGGFIQMEPRAGAPATERTDVWIFFDDTNLYVVARAWDTAPESEWVINEMRRDSPNLSQNEGVGILLVVLIHSLRPNWDPGISGAELWLGSITRFAVPGFFAASGYLYATDQPIAGAVVGLALFSFLLLNRLKISRLRNCCSFE